MTMFPTTVSRDDVKKYFYNRKKDIETIYSYITIRQNRPSQIIVYGPHGVGKTFFVKKILYDQEDDILTIYIDISNLYGINPDMDEFDVLNEILMKINTQINSNKNFPRLRNYIESALQNILMREIDITESVNIFNMQIPKMEKDYSKLSKFVMELPQKIVDSTDDINGVIIVLDEFPLLIHHLKDPEAFFWLIKSTLKNQSNVCYIYSGFTGVYEKCMLDANIINRRNSTVWLHPFNIDETRDYLTIKAPNIKFSNDGFIRFYEYTRGLLAYIHSFCNELNENIEYTCEIIDKVFENKSHQIANMLIYQWNNLSDNQKEVLKYIAEHGPQPRENLKTSDEILYTLTDSHLLIYYDSKYHISDEMLKMWLKNEKKQKGVYPI